jgi:hypothetical protein
VEKVVANSEVNVINNEHLKYVMNKIIFEASDMLQKIHNEAMGKKEITIKQENNQKSFEESEKPNISNGEKSEDQVQNNKLKLIYGKKERTNTGMVIGDSFNLFCIFMRNLKDRSPVTEEMMEKIVIKTKAISQLKSGKAKVTQRNPDNFGTYYLVINL